MNSNNIYVKEAVALVEAGFNFEEISVIMEIEKKNELIALLKNTGLEPLPLPEKKELVEKKFLILFFLCLGGILYLFSAFIVPKEASTTNFKTAKKKELAKKQVLSGQKKISAKEHLEPVNNRFFQKEPTLKKAVLANNDGSYQEIKVENGATIEGVVVFIDPPNHLPSFSINKDQSCCGERKENHRLTIKKGHVRNALVYISSIERGKKWKRQHRTLDQKNCTFHPFIQFMEVGKRINIINSDPILHNIHGYLNGKTVFNIAMPLPGQKIKQSLKMHGMYDFACDAGHYWMSAYLYVSKHPYCAITNEDGEFELLDVPEGNYTIVLWHPGWNIKRTLVNKQGETTGYRFSEPVVLKQKVKLKKGQTKSLAFVLKEKK